MLQTILTIISLFGNYLNCRKMRICFLLWIICNIGWIYVDFSNQAYSRMVLDAVQIGFSVYGFINWADGKVLDGKAKKASFKEWLDKVGTLNIVLICVGAFFLWFNWQLLETFKELGSIPETYACAVIVATIGEAGICGWIRTSKDRKREREWSKEDQNLRKENENDY